ncbi:hypothetical protein [Alkaliphilus oremlandii]|uniref:Pyrrolo-quinoline quinone n=1 Tax=Alkaliphilus oremlandii (strain OhILAs) TaxID=350688 RepID=A8MHX9_ALKOO|nr:hypothetical protein [Alkaliphilus oremlandii]ABW19411.1 conserved hypothetical protein [Alkaliphilus oremlandii OhILAs]
MIEIDSWSIEIHLENDYSIGSVDNIRRYDNLYYADDCNKQNVVELIGIRCTVTGTNALLLADGSPKGLNQSSFIIHGEKIIVCVGNNLFCLNLNDLSLLWTLRCDDSCCFRIFSFENYYLVQGELAISAVTYDGKKLWDFYGKDIFVTPDGNDEIVFSDGRIYIKDWDYNEYVLDRDSILISN